MDPVHDRGSMDPVHESGPWTWSKVGVHGPLVHVLSSPENNCQTATGKPTFSAVMQTMSRHVILPPAFGKEGRNSSTLCAKTYMK